MDFINKTSFPAKLFRGIIDGEDEESMFNSLLIRARYKLTNGNLELLTEGENVLESLREEIIEDEYGILPPDTFMKGKGTDLIIIGDAISIKPVPSMLVEVNAGPYKQSLAIFGNRIWEEDVRGLRPSESTPFQKMPITYNNAYGGQAKSEPTDLPSRNNPIGKGFQLKREYAIGQPLPNIEDPNALIKTFQDQPSPVGFAPYPREWGLRIDIGIEVNQEKQDANIKPEYFFNNAHPNLSGEQLNAGQAISISGMSTHGNIDFQLPTCPFSMEVCFDEKKHLCQFRIEEVLIDLRTSTVDISYRKNFDYKFKPNQIRTTTVLWRK